MATILAIDTTTPSGSLALWRDGLVIGERRLESSTGLAQIVFGELRMLLRDSGVQLREVDCFAAASGPGSFTGVRVCLTVVKGLAEAEGKKVCGVSNLRATAAAVASSTELLAVMLDARRGDVFAALYDRRDGLLSAEVVTRPNQWLASLVDGTNELVVGPGVRVLIDATQMRITEAPLSLAPAIAAIAERDGAAGLWIDPAGLQANYVRRTDAEMHWEDKQR